MKSHFRSNIRRLRFIVKSIIHNYIGKPGAQLNYF